MFRRIVQILFVSLLLSGCATFEEIIGEDYQDSARLNFEEGLNYLKREEYEIAEKYFQLVKNKYSFSQLAKTSELLAADTKFKREQYLDAVDAYKNFQRKHPAHPCVPYSQYRISEAYYEQMPEDWWFMPPVYEKDIEMTEKALREYDRLLNMEEAQDYYYPPDFKPEKITYCKERQYLQTRAYLFAALSKKSYCLHRIIDRELYVANYYLDRDKPRGAIMRLERLFMDHPVTAESADLVQMLATAYEEDHDKENAQRMWRFLAESHRGEEEETLARTRIEELETKALAWTIEDDDESAERRALWNQRKDILWRKLEGQLVERRLKEVRWEEKYMKEMEEERRKRASGELQEEVPPP